MAPPLDNWYRQYAGTVTAALTAKFGAAHLDLIDGAVQEAFARAEVASGEVPDSPLGWLITVAKNITIDEMRAQARRLARERAVSAAWVDAVADRAPVSRYQDEIADDLLRMMFVCCDPALAPASQVMLTLRTLGGLSIGDLAAAYMVSEDAVAKRLTRARGDLRAAGVSMDLPPDALAARVDGVLGVLYGLFSEGYASHDPAYPLRADLCGEAIRLAAMVADHPVTNTARADALLALMLLQGARLPARQAGDGGLLTLEEQDRGLWRTDLIAAGIGRLDASRRGDRVDRFHLEAGIAACHATAASVDMTDWTAIGGLYDQLLALSPSPVVAINRAIAKGMAEGADAGLALLDGLRDGGYLLIAARGELLSRRGDAAAARACFEAAALKAPDGAARLGLARRVAMLLSASQS